MAQKTAQKVPEWQSYGNFCKVTQNPHFLKKYKGGPKDIFQKSPNKSPRLKGLKALWRNWHYPLISMHLKGKNWRRFWRKPQPQKCPNGQVMAIFARSPKPAFSDNVQKREQRKFFKSRRKSCLRLKDPKAIWREWHYPLISIYLNCKDWKRFWRKQRLQKYPNGQVMAIFARSPKTRIF